MWRTMLMDRVGGGKRAEPHHAAILYLPSSFFKAQEQFESRDWVWLAGMRGYCFRWERFLQANSQVQLGPLSLQSFFKDEIPADVSEHAMTEAHAAYERSVRKRRFMTTANGYMGWAPDNIYGSLTHQTRKGDLIAIIFGCSTPLVIRPLGPHYQVLGEAYVHGVVDGEAMSLLHLGKVKVQRFTFS